MEDIITTVVDRYFEEEDQGLGLLLLLWQQQGPAGDGDEGIEQGLKGR